MALATNLENLLKHMDPTVAEAQRKFWEANPAIAEAVDKGTIPRDVFSRELNAKDEEVKKAREAENKIREWEKENRPKHDKLVADFERVEQEKAELERKIAEAAGKAGDDAGVDVNEQKLMTNVLAKLEGRTVSESKLKEIIAGESKKLADETRTMLETARKDFLEKTFPATTQFQAALMDVMSDYRAETGKKLDRKEFSKFMEEHSILDPTEAFERFMAPQREEKRIKEEVEKRVQDELGKRNMPGVTPGQTVPSELGPLQLKIAGEGVKYPEGSELGDRSASNMAAKELREQGAF